MKKRAFLGITTLFLAFLGAGLTGADLTEVAADKLNNGGKILAIRGENNYLFNRGELEHLKVDRKFWGADSELVSKSSNKKFADSLVALADFNRQLKERGIKLIVMSVPPKAIIEPEALVMGNISRLRNLS